MGGIKYRKLYKSLQKIATGSFFFIINDTGVKIKSYTKKQKCNFEKIW